MKSKIFKISYIVIGIMLIIPSLVYLINNRTVMGENIYYNFFLNNSYNKTISTIIYLILFIAITIIYFFICRKNYFKDIKSILKYVAIAGLIFLLIIPWTSSDIYYYMGVGELDARYGENPYYTTMKDYYKENSKIINDEILEKGANNYWAGTTVVYGPIAQIFFKVCSFVSFKNVTLALFVFKIVNLLIHIINTYMIYKLTNKKIFTLIYGLNPFILFEAIANVHNDIIILFFVLFALYYLIKKKNLLVSIIFLALATGIKYFTILLLPVVILYHFRDEKRLGVRFLRCIEYGIIFVFIYLIEYLPYFKDYTILLSMVAQTERYSGSLYVMLLLDYGNHIMSFVKFILRFIFVTAYILFCIKLLTTKEIKFYKAIREYSITVCLFLLILTNFHPWYLMWLFPTIMWLKPNGIKNVIGISMCTELASSVYMFNGESYRFDGYYIRGIIIMFILWILFTNKPFKRKMNQEINKVE